MIRYEIDYRDELTDERQHERGLISIQGTIGNHVDYLYNYFGKDNVIGVKIYECPDILSDAELLEITKENT